MSLIQRRFRATRIGRTAKIVSAVTAASTCAAVGLLAFRPAGGTTVTTIDQTVGQAVSNAAGAGVTSAVAVIDNQTGKLYTAGNATSYYGSASVMKLFVATRLLAGGKLRNASIAAKAYSMITRSDDNALNALLPLVGGTSVVNWVKRYYGISFLGAPSLKRGCWGNTQITAKGIAYFYHRMLRDSRVAPWLVNALHHYQARGADGTDQTFGIPKAASGVGVKQGWGGNCSSNTNGSVINSTGLVGGNRFAVAILTNTNKWAANAHAYNANQANVVSTMAKTLMPHGYVDLPEAHNPVGRVDSMAAKSTTVTVSGWALDPDLRSGSMTVRVTEGSVVRWQQVTSVPRPDVNVKYHASGNHGFKAVFTAANGRHEYCVRFVNYGAGNGSPAVCRVVNVVVLASPVPRPGSTSPGRPAPTTSTQPTLPHPGTTAAPKSAPPAAG